MQVGYGQRRAESGASIGAMRLSAYYLRHVAVKSFDVLKSMVRLPFGGLPPAAILPPLTLLVLLMPNAGHAYEPTAEHQPSNAGLRWVADDQPASATEAPQVVTTPEPKPSPVSHPILTSPVPVAIGTGLVWTAEENPIRLVAVDDQDNQTDFHPSLTGDQLTDRHGELPLAENPDVETQSPLSVPVPVVASKPLQPTRSGLVWTSDDAASPLLVVDDQRDPDQSLIELQQIGSTVQSPLADIPVIAAPPLPLAPVQAIVSQPFRPTPSGLVWTEDDVPTSSVAVNPAPDLQNLLTDTTRDLTQATTAVADAPQPLGPIASGLHWEVDEEFSALLAANPASSPVELLASAPPRIISVETVVEQLQLAAHQPDLSPEDVASLLVQAHSPQLIKTDPSPASVSHNVVPIAVDFAVTAGGEGVVTFSQHHSTEFRANYDRLQTALLAVHSTHAMEDNLKSPQVSAPISHSRSSDDQNRDYTEPFPTGDAGISEIEPHLARLEDFLLKPILLPGNALTDVQQQPTQRLSSSRSLISANPRRVSFDRPVGRASRVAALGLGLQFLSW